MAEPSPPPPSNAGLRILLSKDRPPSSTAVSTVSSHADRDRIIGVFRSALSRTEPPETFALQTVQEAIKPQKETVLVLEENQSLENALRTLLQELVVRFLMWLHESLFSPNDKIVRDCYRHLHFSGPLHH